MEYSSIFIIILHKFFDLEEIISENFRNSESKIISVEVAKVLGCLLLTKGFFLNILFSILWGVSGPLIIHKRTYPKFVRGGH
jgi:uncharacterized membrane protein